jgi:hypothetical protein
VLIPSSHDLACLVEPLAIHLDPTEPSGDMDYTFSLRGTRRLRAPMRDRDCPGRALPQRDGLRPFSCAWRPSNDETFDLDLSLTLQANRSNSWLTKHGGTNDLCRRALCG